MKKFNEWLAVKMTMSVSNMYAVYLFIIYGLVPARFPEYTTQILYWSNFCQLVFLPVILVSSAVIGRKAETQAKETHDTVMAQFQELKETHLVATEELEELKFTHSTMLEELVEIRKIMNLLQGGNEHGK